MNVFPEELPGVPPIRETKFTIELFLDTKSISIPPYHMAPAELKELKIQLQELLDKGFIRPQCISMGNPSFVCKKERWHFETVCQLQTIKSGNNEE